MGLVYVVDREEHALQSRVLCGSDAIELRLVIEHGTNGFDVGVQGVFGGYLSGRCTQKAGTHVTCSDEQQSRASVKNAGVIVEERRR